MSIVSLIKQRSTQVGTLRPLMETLVQQDERIATGVDVPTDGPNSWNLPQTSAHFTSLGLAAPDYWVLFGGAGPDFTPAIDGLSIGDLVAFGTGAHEYQISTAGWDALGAGSLVSGTQVGWQAQLATIAAGQSLSTLALMAFGSGSNGRPLAPLNTGRGIQHAGTHIFIKGGSGTSSGLLNYSGTGVRMMRFYRNASTNVSGGITDSQNVTFTHGEAEIVAPYFGIGSTTQQTGAPGTYTAIALGVWVGANAEQDWATYDATLTGA